MDRPECQIGIVGLGVMGRNLLLNAADHGFPAAGYDLDAAKVQMLLSQAAGGNIRGAASPAELAGLLRTPRVVMLLVPAGPPVDAAINNSCPIWNPAMWSWTAATRTSKTRIGGGKTWQSGGFNIWA